MSDNPDKIDLPALINNNPLTRLSRDYGSKIIEKIRLRFKAEDQQLFVANFYCYLNYNQKTDFVINLDRIWKWLGYNRINDCSRLLINNFTKDIDYKIEKAALEDGKAGLKLSQEGKNLGGAGMNREYITLTVNCFKKLCLKSRTEKADQIHDYYVGLEELMNELVAEQTKELQLKLQNSQTQLQNSQTQLKLQNSQKEQHMLINFSKKPVIYVGYTEIDIVKTGYTDDIENRLKDHKREIGKDFILEFIYESTRNREIERQMYKHSILSKRRLSKKYPGREEQQTELFQLDKQFTIMDLDKIIKDIKYNIESNSVLQNEINYLEIENKILKDALVPKIKEIKLINEEAIFPIIAYDINTKSLSRLEKLADAKRYLNVDPITIKNYINNRKHLNCKILSTDIIGPYWILPSNFKFSNVVKQTLQNIYIKRIDKITDEITYFNSITEASLYLQQEIDDNEITCETTESIKLKKALGELLRNVPTRKPILLKYKWYKMKQIGFIINVDGSKICIDEQETVNQETINKKTVNQKPIEPSIIIRDLDTDEEHIYPEGYSVKIYKQYGMRKETLDKFLNKPHNYKNYTFRTIGNPYWNPPKTYMRNSQLDNARVNYYLKVLNNLTSEITYHHSITDIALSLFPNEDKTNISHYLMKKMYNGSNPTLLINYDIIKLETCGELIYPDGKIENIEK